MHEELQISELHITPTYAVHIPQRSYRGGSRSKLQKENELNLKDNSQNGVLSYKATKRLRNSINWLVASAESKRVYDKSLNKSFSFKVNFITLTLPSLDLDISDHFFKKVLLHNFINTCKYKFGLQNYVWKVEAQKNGNIHAHFTTDVFMHWRELRTVWNNILKSNGLLDSYHAKHVGMTFKEYCSIYNPKNKHDKIRMRIAYNKGVKSNWYDPNSTDVHAVYKVKNIAGYLASYMSKKEEGKRPIKGRLWSSSTSLSSENKLVLELHGNEDNDLLDSFDSTEIKWTPIIQTSKTGLDSFKVGDLYLFNMNDWGKVLKGRLFDFYLDHLFKIRNGLDFNFFESVSNIVSTVKDLIIIDPPPEHETNNFQTVIF